MGWPAWVGAGGGLTVLLLLVFVLWALSGDGRDSLGETPITTWIIVVVASVAAGLLVGGIAAGVRVLLG